MVHRSASDELPDVMRCSMCELWWPSLELVDLCTAATSGLLADTGHVRTQARRVGRTLL